MKYIPKNCKTCNKSFNADLREHNRGNAHYCSLSCCAKMPKRLIFSNICKHCGRGFNTNSRNSKYCSNLCKQKSYRLNSNINSINIKNFYKQLDRKCCEICKWSETICDLHHIIEVSNGGTNELSNLIVVCPNHHRMIHKNLISKDYLVEIVKARTISSS